MDKSYGDFYTSSLDQDFIEFDLQNYLFSLHLRGSEIEALLKLDCDFTANYLQDQDYSFYKYHKVPELRMSKVKSTKVYLKLFEKLALYHPEVEALVIWWSELSDLFFDNLRHLRTLIRVYFVSCEMGDGLSSQLSRLQLKDIKDLCLSCDPIGNRGVRQLMKLQVPALQVLVLTNTNITTDCIKLVKRMPLNKFTQLGLTDQLGFNAQLHLKEVSQLILHPRKPLQFIFGINNHPKSPPFLYMSVFSKLKLEEGCLSFFKLSSHCQSVFGSLDKKTLLIPIRELNVLASIYIIDGYN